MEGSRVGVRAYVSYVYGINSINSQTAESMGIMCHSTKQERSECPAPRHPAVNAKPGSTGNNIRQPRAWTQDTHLYNNVALTFPTPEGPEMQIATGPECFFPFFGIPPSTFEPAQPIVDQVSKS